MFWTNQELLHAYKSPLTGIGNRGSVDNFDDTIFSFIIMLNESIINVKNDVSVLTRYLISDHSQIIRANSSRE